VRPPEPNQLLVSYLENELAPSLSLDGQWQFSLAGGRWQAIPVPAAWEAHIADKMTDGPARYVRSFELPADWFNGASIVLEADAISFDATVRINGENVGTHRGMWSPFQFDVTHAVRPGNNRAEVEVWKPGGRFPVRESLAGFLPDVITTFGGIWQGVRLRALRAGLSQLHVYLGDPLRVHLSGIALVSNGPAEILAEVAPDDGHTPPIRLHQSVRDGPFALDIDTTKLRRWHPAAPARSRVTVSLIEQGEVVARVSRMVGFRSISADHGLTTCDGQPLHMRGVLDWGWYPDLVRPAPDRARLERQFAQVRALGFNMVKLCLFVPDELTFEVADETGMLLWLEMPMWLPKVTPALRALALSEYAAVFHRVHHHPSIVVLSLGCELGAAADAGFLQALNELARMWFPSVLHCDNSGSAEAYGGVQTALSDFYDYHFYTDPHHFASLVEYFDRQYQPRKPWLYGEFCDADTCRDFNLLEPEPWWLREPVALRRDDYLAMRDYRQRLARAGITDGAAGLVRRGRAQATAVRKFILEHARLHSGTGGYVVSGWVDTPITTSGIVDDTGQLKFDPDVWWAFNSDAVLLIDRERRRLWVGGDRPAYRDPFAWRAEERGEFHVLVSNGGGDIERGELDFEFASGSGEILKAGATPVRFMPGGVVREIAVLRWEMPRPIDDKPLQVGLRLRLSGSLVGGSSISLANSWTLWVYPDTHLPRPLLVAGNLATSGLLERLDRDVVLIPLRAGANPGPVVAVATELSEELLAWVAAGGRALLWQRQPERSLTLALPFWREAIHVFQPHALWQRMPVEDHADMRFYSLAGDLALDGAGLQARLGEAARLQPVWRRFDARAMGWAEYVIDVAYGDGRLLATTLNLEGGLGRQPPGLHQSPAGAWMFASLLRQLTDYYKS
jgi:hypothetical protein